MTPWLTVALCSFIVPSYAQTNGMVMSMDVPMDLAIGNMLPYAHFTPGDNVWFIGWVPSTTSAMVGTCIGVFLLAILERWLSACLEFAERHWADSAMALEKADSFTSLPSASEPSAPTKSLPGPGKSNWSRIPPFVPEFEIARGVLFSALWFLKIFLMMAVMTFQLSFLISIAIGSGVGETLFGRFSSSHSEH